MSTLSFEENSQQPGLNPARGLEIDNPRTRLDWQMLKDDVIDFVYLRASDGLKPGGIDIIQQFAAAAQAGALYGALHFFRPEQKGLEQAEFFLQATGYAAAGRENIALPPALDLRLAGQLRHDDLLAQLEAWLKTVEERSARRTLIFTNKDFWNKQVKGPDWTSAYPLWLAAPGDVARLPAGWNEWRLRQQTAGAQLKGASQPVGLHQYNGSLDELRAWLDEPPYQVWLTNLLQGVAIKSFGGEANLSAALVRLQASPDFMRQLRAYDLFLALDDDGRLAALGHILVEGALGLKTLRATAVTRLPDPLDISSFTFKPQLDSTSWNQRLKPSEWKMLREYILQSFPGQGMESKLPPVEGRPPLPIEVKQVYIPPSEGVEGISLPAIPIQQAGQTLATEKEYDTQLPGSLPGDDLPVTKQMPTYQANQPPDYPAADEPLPFNGLSAYGGYLFEPAAARTLADQAQAAWRGALRDELQKVIYRGRGDDVSFGVGIDETNLSEAGWGVLFPANTKDENVEIVRRALAPLLELRQAQAGKLYQELTYRPGSTLDDFLKERGVSPGVQDPQRLPLYLLVVGNPGAIPQNFVRDLNQVVSSGRLVFSTLDSYARYARNLVTVESSSYNQPRRAAIFAPQHPDDAYSQALGRTLVEPFAARMRQQYGERAHSDALVGEQATKTRLLELLGSSAAPTLLFAGAHGLGFPRGDARQVTHQGALVTADWSGPDRWSGRELLLEHYIAAEDLPRDLELRGLIACLHSSYAVATPVQEANLSRPTAAFDFGSSLSARLLDLGALAVIGPAGRLFSSPRLLDQAETGLGAEFFTNLLGGLLYDKPLGMAWNVLRDALRITARSLANQLEEAEYGKEPPALRLAQLWTAFLDLLGLMIAGDPAARLPRQTETPTKGDDRIQQPIGQPTKPSPLRLRLADIQLPDTLPEPATLVPGQVFTPVVKVENIGQTLPPANARIRVGVQWLNPDGSRSNPITQTVRLPRSLKPGQQHGWSIDLAAANTPGEYTLLVVLDPLQPTTEVEPADVRKALHVASALPDYASEIVSLSGESRHPAELPYKFDLAIRNTGRLPWLKGQRFELHSDWRKSDLPRSKSVSHRQATLALQDEVPPGAQVEWQAELRIGMTPGDYQVNFRVLPLDWKIDAGPLIESRTITLLPPVGAIFESPTQKFAGEPIFGEPSRLSWQAPRPPQQLEAQAQALLGIEITNGSGPAWPQGRTLLAVVRWLDPDGKPVDEKTTEISLDAIPAGGNAGSMLNLAAPAQAGEYQLALSLQPQDWAVNVEPPEQTYPILVTAPQVREVSRLTWTPEPPEPVLIAGQTLPLIVQAKNVAGPDWEASTQFQLDLAWRATDRAVFRQQAQSTLEAPLAANEEKPITFQIQSPENRGVYTLQLTLKPLGWECQVSPKSKRWESLQVLSAAILPRGSWQVSRLPASLEAGQTGPIQIAITNRSDKNWEKGRQFELVASWRKGRSRLSSQTLRSDLPFPAPANATVERTVSFDLQMPGEAGDYILSLSLRPVGWEALLEPASQRLSFTVTPSTKPYGLELSMLATTPSLQAGQPYTAQIRLHNISTATWMTGEQFEVQCAFQQPPTEFTNPWGSWSFALEAPVAAKRQTPQQKFTLETNGLPPGDYSLSWQARSLSNPEMAPASLAATLKIEAPPPAPASPPAETSLALPEAYAGDAFAVNYFNNVILPIAQPASQQVDEHMLEVQVMPAPPVQSGQAIPGSPQAQYLVYLTVAEDDSGNSVRNYYRGPLALPGAADTLAELGDFKTGAGLFKSLFHTDQPDNLLRLQRGEKGLPCLLDGYNRAVQRGLADQEDTLRIQLRLPLELPQLHTIRWEYLWDPAGEQGGPLACSERTPFARVLPTASSVDYQPPAISSAAPLRVLVAVSSPGNLADKGLMPITAPEVQAVQDALKLQDAMVRYDMLLDASRETLRKELQAATEAHHPYQALHLLCHGVIREKDGRACLVLNTPGSTLAEEVPDSLLCEILQPFVPGLSLIVLASCLTALPANHEPLQGVGRRLLADAEIPAVVAMQGKLEFTAAQYFSQRLYAQLVAHGEIDRAVNAARRELYAKRWLGPGYSKELTVQANQWGMPVLFTRLVDGRLFTLPEKGVDQTMTQAKPYEQMAGSQTGAVLASAARSAAAALGVQINLSLPSLAQAFGQAVQAAPAVVAPPRLFDQPEQVQSRWRLVWQAAQHRQHPARRAVLFLRGEARRSAERLLREMLDFDGSELDFATRYQALYQTQIWESGPLTYGNQPIPAVLGAGPQPEDNLARDANNQVVHSAAWRAGLRGWDVFSGQDLPDPQKVKIGGNLTWRMEERSQPPFRMPRQTDLQALLSAQDPPASFEALVHPLQGQPVFDEQLASYLLYALNPDIYPFYSTALAKNALQVLDLAGHPRYSQGYAGFCNLALDLLEDDDLGFESLGDVGYFLQRLAASYLPAIPPKPTPGLRVKLEAVNIRSEKVDSELVIQPGVLEQAAAALNAGKHTIMIGPPGTGKTTLAEDLCRFAHDMNFNRGHVLVTATADWTTFDTIGGYMPESGDRLKFRPGIFLEAIAAGKWLVIDEINRADIDKAFGELFTVLSGQAVTLPYKIDGRFVRILPPSSASTGAPGEYHIHPSWRIIGTMNIYDKASLFAMSYAFMRRFAFIDVAVPAPRPYQRLLGNFLERWKLKAAGEEPTQPGLVTARHTLEYLLDASDSANKLMAHRALGPAIALDLIRYLRARSHNGKLPYHHGQLAEAISLYVLPQLDGLEQEHILEVYGYFHSLFKSAAADTEIAPSVEAVKRRIRELFPFIPAIKWKEQEA